MNKRQVLDFANELGLQFTYDVSTDSQHRREETIYRFFHVSLAPRHGNRRWELIATLRLDDQMNIVDYNNALAICMNTLKQYQSWS